MLTQSDNSSKSSKLRQKAEAEMETNPAGNSSATTESDTLKLIHELEVQRIELEMQNEELRAANDIARDAIELYDFAPTGYFTLSPDGEIMRLNLSGAKLLGKERSLLLNKKFAFFTSNETKPVFQHFLNSIFAGNNKQSCEVVLAANGSSPVNVQLNGIVTENALHCLITATDITEHKSREALNEILLSSLPYPAMYIRKKDMVVLSANKSALALGVKPGGQCWREFMKAQYLSDEDKQMAAKYPDIVPESYHIRCNFCQADKCFVSALAQNDPNVNALGGVWDTYWIKVSDEVFLHYAVNISERKHAEDQIKLAHARLRHFVDSDIVGIVISKADGKVLETNDYYLNTIGYSRKEFEAGLVNWRTITPPEWLDADEFAIKEVNEKGKCTPYEKEYLRRDGTRVDVQITDAILPGPEKHIASFVLDISERKRAQKALQESEAKYRELIENSPDAIIIYSDGKIVLANKESLNLMAVESEDELLGRKIINFIHPHYRAAVMHRMQKMKEDGIAVPVNEERFVRPNGSEVDVEVKAVAVKFENTAAVHLIIRDITERKKAEVALRLSEDRTKALLEANPDMMFVLDKNERFVDFHAKDQIYLYAVSSFFIGKKIAEVLPADMAVITGFQLKKLFETGKMQVHNYQLLVHDELRDFESRLVICGDSNALSIVRDITERKRAEKELLKSEAKFHELFEANTDGILLIPFTGDEAPSTIMDMNENAAKMLGYSKMEMLGLTLADIEKGTSIEEIEIRKQDLLSKGMTNFETVISHKDGHEINVEVKVMTVNYNNQPALMNIVRDITTRVHTEIQLHKYAIELSRQNSEKDKFFSIIAHDLRGPFYGFLGLTQIMTEKLQDLTPDELKKMAFSMRTSATHLFRLLENLLNWARIEQGTIPFNPKNIHLYPQVSESFAMAFEAAHQKGITLNSAVSEDIEVFADVNMLQTIIRNLVSNALKYSSAGGTVKVSAKALKNEIEISVRDSGIGMSDEMCKNLFRINAQTNRKGTAGEPSTGLGLIICKEFIEKNGGEIHIESNTDERRGETGSTIRFTLPCSSTLEDTPETIKIMKNDNAIQPIKALKILIAEDDEVSEMLISITYKSLSKEILKVGTGREAVEVFKRNPDIDLVMMDIQMPDMDGYEAARQIRLLNTSVVIIAQTAYGKAGDRERALKAGFNDYVSKPTSIALLRGLIDMHFKMK